MFRDKFTIIITFCLMVLSVKGQTQLFSSNDSINIIVDSFSSGNDSIHKKHNKSKHSNDFLEGKQDASQYYTDNKVFILTFATSMLFPPAGVLTTIAVSTTRPKYKNLDVPNKLLLNNKEYAKGYIQKASRKKAGRAWLGSLTGMSFFAVLYTIFFIAI